ncbi:adhesion exoprotein [Levilactobacillus koreensis JCM 16448]|nr:adhesion exoprotein [Levilactobacillus koreensis JCM 16448]
MQRNERQWAALAFATAAIGIGVLATGPIEGAQAATIPSASAASSAAATSPASSGLTVISAATQVVAPAVASTASQAAVPASSAASATSAASSVAGVTSSSAENSQETTTAGTSAATSGQSSAASSAATATLGSTAATSESTASATTSAVFDWQTDETTGTATIMGVNQAVSGTLRLPSTYVSNGKTYQVTSIGTGAFAAQTGFTTGLTGVVFNSGLQTIGDSAFAYLDNLKTADFTADQSLTTVGSQAFVGTGLTQIALPSQVTTIGSDAFKYVGGVTNLQLPANLVSLGTGAFSEDSNLTTVDLAPATALATIGSEAFAGDGLTTLTIPATVQDIGAGAFMTDQQLTTVNFAATSQLATIENSAFMYDTALKSLTLPDSVQTIGDQAFLSDQSLQAVTLGDDVLTIGNNAFTYDGGLTTLHLSRATQLIAIGDGAFEYAGITGALTLPASVQTLGDLAFAGNHVTTLNLDGALQNLGNDVFGSNQLAQITGPTLPGLAQNQFVTIFADPHELTLADLLTVKLGQLTPADVTVSDVTNATYQNGQFTVTPGQTSFTFNWSLANTDGAIVYAGQATVDLSNPAIKAINSTVLAGSAWQPADNFVSATAPDHSAVPLSAVTVTGTVNTAVVGTYPITYSYQDASSTVTVTVTKRSGTYQLVGAPQVVYTGQQPTLVPTDYQVELPDGQTYTPQLGDLTTAATAAVGTYPVTLTTAGIAHLQALPESNIYNWTLSGQGSLQVVPAPVTLTVSNETEVAGATEPLLTVNVSGLPANGVPLNYTVQRVDGEAVGTYPITVALGANPDYAVTVINGVLTITPTPVTPPLQSSAASGAIASSSAASVATSSVAPASSAAVASSSSTPTEPSSAASVATSSAAPASSAAVSSSSATPTKPSSAASAATSSSAPASSAAVSSSSATSAEPSSATSSASPASSAAVSSSSAMPTKPSSAASTATSSATSMVTSVASSATSSASTAAKPASSSASTSESAVAVDPAPAVVQPGSAADSAMAPASSSAPDRTGETHTVTGDVAVPATTKKSGQPETLHVAVDRVTGKKSPAKQQTVVRASAKDLAVKGTQPDRVTRLKEKTTPTATQQRLPQSVRQTALPQTGEKSTASWSIVGVLLGILSVLGFRRRRD